MNKLRNTLNASSHCATCILCAFAILFFNAAIADTNKPQLLFYVSAKENLTADIAAGEAQPNFRDNIKRTHTGIPD